MYNDKKYDNFLEKFNIHNQLVQKYCNKIANIVPDIGANEIIQRGIIHDHSKLGENELEAHIHRAWMYKCQADGVPYNSTPLIDQQMETSRQHHVLNNRHHPEYFMNNDNTITTMPMIDIAEMVADWCSIADELHVSTPLIWAKKHVNVEWFFCDEDTIFIFDVMDIIWDK